MKLKRLSLQGYKTFASKTNFEFDEGITAIVGPNGSGKSNIADAIRWVLGEQSYSTLRGKRTTDMIFAGSQQRARAGMAQAILTLDNSEGWLPIDFSEIEIGRRAHRSGDNEYLLNGQKVRLRDITDLLAKSGLAQRTYTIIGQGLIDQALSLRAEERRMLFEEAAGVSHYKQRRAETLRRLDETTHNLERVQDIIAEIRPRMNSLQRQASRARNYEQLAADLRHLLQLWYGYKWEQARESLRDARRESEEARQQWMDARRRQLGLQEKLDNGRKALSILQDQLRAMELEREDTRERFETARREVAVLSERKALLKRQLDEHAGELPALKAQQEAAARQLEQASRDLELAQAELDQQSQELKTFESSFLTQQDEIDRWQQNVSELANEHGRAADALSQAKGRVAQLASQLRERLADSGDGFDLSEAEQDVQRLEEKLASARQEHLESRQDLSAANDRRRALQESLDASRSGRDDLAAQRARLDQKFAAIESRIELLDRPGPGEGQIPDDLPVEGQLAAALDVPEQMQTAVRAALAEKYLAWLLSDEAALWQLHEGQREGRVVALNVQDEAHEGGEADSYRPTLPDEAHILGWADELVRIHEPYGRLAMRLLRRVLIVSEAQSAYQLAARLPAGYLAVSTDGFVAHPEGIVELGAENVGAARLARLEQSRVAQEERDGLLAIRDDLGEKLVAAQAEIDALRASLAEAATQCQALEERERSLSASASQALSAHRLAQQKQEFDLTNVKRARQSIELLEQRLTEGEATVVQFEGAVTSISLSLEEAKGRLETLPVAESDEARRQLQQSLQSARTILAGRQAVVDSRQTTLNQVTDQLRRRQARHDELQSRWQASQLEAKEANLQALDEEMGTLRQRLEPLREQIDERQRAVTQLEDELTGLQRGSHDAETRYTQARIDLTQQESMIESLKERIHGDLGLVSLTYDDDQPAQSPLPIAEVVEQLPEVESLPDDIEESIQSYRGQLNRIGAINPEAPAEYEETVERHEFLTQQVEDLSATRLRLREVIDDLDDLTSRAFAETVDRVNGFFGDVFRRLFGGGSAQLALTDPDDLTITGVDIVARLPRRREQGLALLSGGERSLTAAALIFALLKVSPTPFCVLDEVDAMLDEANVNRFRELLTELSERTQFIVITHNRGTVQVAESVYGVSMGADSVSQVISIKPEEYIRQHA